MSQNSLGMNQFSLEPVFPSASASAPRHLLRLYSRSTSSVSEGSASSGGGSAVFYNLERDCGEEASSVGSSSVSFSGGVSSASFSGGVSSASASVGMMYKVQFKSTEDNFLLADNIVAREGVCIGAYVKVEADRGHDVGVVADIYWPSPEEVLAYHTANPKQIVSLASESDLLLMKGKSAEEARALAICKEFVVSRNMKATLIDAEYQYDRMKLTFFFTSEGHTDFRELVRDLFALFKTRIWMQKIKPDEAAAFRSGLSFIPRSNGGGNSKRQQPSRGSLTQQQQQPYFQQQGSGGVYPQQKYNDYVNSNSNDQLLYRSQVRLHAKRSPQSSDGGFWGAHENDAQPRYLPFHNSTSRIQDDIQFRREMQGSMQGHGSTEQSNYQLYQQHSSRRQSDQMPQKPQPQFHRLSDPYQQLATPSSSECQQYTSFSAYVERCASTGHASSTPCVHTPSRFTGNDFGDTSNRSFAQSNHASHSTSYYPSFPAMQHPGFNMD